MAEAEGASETGFYNTKPTRSASRVRMTPNPAHQTRVAENIAPGGSSEPKPHQRSDLCTTAVTDRISSYGPPTPQILRLSCPPYHTGVH